MNKEQILENFIIDVMNYVTELEIDTNSLKKIENDKNDSSIDTSAFLLGCIGSRIKIADELNEIIDKALNQIEKIEIEGR